MGEDCFGIPQFLGTPQLQNVYGLPHFNVFCDSREFCKSNIAVDAGRRKKPLIK
jgi:hypothetical protein